MSTRLAQKIPNFFFILFDLVHFKVDILVPYSHNFSSGVSSTSPNSPGKLFFLNKYLIFVISGVWVTSFQHWFKFKNKKIAGSQVWSVLRLGENCHLIFSTKWIDKFELARCRGEWTMSSPAITFFLRSCCKNPLWYSRLTLWQATKQWATAWHWIETVVRGDHLPIHYDLLHEYFSIVGVSRSFK